MKFEEIHDQMKPLLLKLEASNSYSRETIRKLVLQSGVYVFYENDKEMYVGRVGHLSKQDIKTRVRQHYSGNVKQAPLAAVMLRKDLKLKTGPGAPHTIAYYAETKFKAEFEDLKKGNNESTKWKSRPLKSRIVRLGQSLRFTLP